MQQLDSPSEIQTSAGRATSGERKFNRMNLAVFLCAVVLSALNYECRSFEPVEENHASLILTDCPRGECCECGDTNGDCNPHDEDGKCCDYYLPDGTCCPCGGEEAYPGMWLCHPRDNNGECCPDFMWDWENRFQCCECGVTMVNGYKKCNAKDGAGKCCIAYSTDGACCPCGASLVDGALKCHEEDWVGNCCEAYLADGTCCPCGTIHVEGTVRCNVKDWIGNCCVAYLKDGTCCRKEDSLCLLTKSLQTQG